MSEVYLDNAASTMIHPDVVEAMNEWHGYANAGSPHRVGVEAKKMISQARSHVAEFLNCDDDQVVFTSGGSESNATVMRGHISNFGANAWENCIAVSKVEHESVINNATIAHKSKMFDIPWFVEVESDGKADIRDLERLFRTPETDIRLVSIMAANNEVPAINDVKSFAELCHEHGADFHTDCVQAVGSIDLDTKSIGCDFLSLSAHKFHGPKGVGVLYVRDKSKLVPLIAGGDNQEFGIRGGTENVAGIIGIDVATKKIALEKHVFTEKITCIKHAFYHAFISFMSLRGLSEKVHINGDFDDDRTKLLSITIDDVDAQSLVLAMSARDVFISAGSACTSQRTESSHVLKAMGFTDKQAHNTVRVSFSIFNTELEAIYGAMVMAECAAFIAEGGLS